MAPFADQGVTEMLISVYLMRKYNSEIFSHAHWASMASLFPVFTDVFLLNQKSECKSEYFLFLCSRSSVNQEPPQCCCTTNLVLLLSRVWVCVSVCVTGVCCNPLTGQHHTHFTRLCKSAFVSCCSRHTHIDELLPAGMKLAV